MPRYVLALDLGTTSSRSILVDHAGAVKATAQKEFPQLYPSPGHVEHDPEAIWSTQLRTARRVLRQAKAGRNDPFAALCLAAMARQMFDLGRPEDGLELVQLGQYGTRRTATPTLQALLLTREAWAYAQMGLVREFHRAVGQAQDSFAQRRPGSDPWPSATRSPSPSKASALSPTR